MTSLKRIGCAAAFGMALVLGSGLLAFPTRAGYVVTLNEVGNDVVATGSGPIDLTGLHFSNSSDGVQNKAFIFPSVGNIITGPAVETMQDYYNPNAGLFVGPTSFGSGFITDVVNGSGDIVGILQDLATLIVPEGYVSGAPLKNIAIYNDQSFGSLGVTAGTYVWTWGTGSDQNFTLVIPALGSVLIPEPASAALLGMALAGLLLAVVHAAALRIHRTPSSAATLPFCHGSERCAARSHIALAISVGNDVIRRSTQTLRPSRGKA